MMQRKKDHNGSKLLLSFTLIIVGLILLVNAQQNKDCPSYRTQSYFPKMRYENDGTVTRSEYLTMRDGVKIACDLYLPYRAVNENHRLPTLLHITRYFRSYKVNWPFNYLLGDKISINGIPFPKFLARGYAIVSCDTRGSGVSFGMRLYDFHRDEVQDFKEVLDWITKQKFSNGKIVASGISYDGMVTDFLTSLNHPALVAVSSVSGPFDIYRDTIYPGGIYQKSFIDYYLKFTQVVESGKMITRSDLCLGCAPETLKEKILDKLAKLLLGGVQPADDNDLETMRKAFESHKDSTDMLDVVHHLEKGINKIVTTDKFTYEMERDGPMRVIADNKKRIPMLVFGGYYESMVLNSVVKRFYSLYHKDSKLFMGPYNHGLKVMNSPYAENNSPCFDAFEEVMRFFDHHLGLEENLGLENEKQVHYYAVGAEKWFSVDSWPPKSEEQVWHLTNAGALVSEKSELNQVLKLDMEQETLIDSKWNMLTSLFQKATKYPATLSSPEFSNGKLNYISQPLSEDLDVTGYPHLTVELSANNRDGLIFAYLQEVDAKGTVNFIMDTQLRLVHRKLNTHRNTSGLIDVVPHHTFYLEDRQYLEPNQKTSIQLYFPAVSYTVKKGHSLKLSLFSFDKINFKIFENESDLSSELLLHTASIHLPIVHARLPESSSDHHSKDEL